MRSSPDQSQVIVLTSFGTNTKLIGQLKLNKPYYRCVCTLAGPHAHFLQYLFFGYGGYQSFCCYISVLHLFPSSITLLQLYQGVLEPCSLSSPCCFSTLSDLRISVKYQGSFEWAINLQSSPLEDNGQTLLFNYWKRREKKPV
jgi:hypothetical protein